MIMKEFQNGLASTLKGLLGTALNVLDLNSTTNLSVQSSLASGLKTIFTSVLYRPMLVCGKSVYSVFSSTIRGLLAVVLGCLRWLKNQIKNLVDFFIALEKPPIVFSFTFKPVDAFIFLLIRYVRAQRIGRVINIYITVQ